MVRHNIKTVTTLATALLAAGVSDPALSAQLSNPWSLKTQVQAPDTANPACERLSAALHAKIAEIARLRASTEYLEKRGPQSVKGMLEGWMGQPYTNRKVQEQRSKVAKATALAEELNSLAASSGCPRMDIDQELKVEAAKLEPVH